MCAVLPGQLDVGNKGGALGPRQTVQVNVSGSGASGVCFVTSGMGVHLLFLLFE